MFYKFLVLQRALKHDISSKLLSNLSRGIEFKQS